MCIYIYILESTGALRAPLILLTQLLVDVGNIEVRTIHMHFDHKTCVARTVSESVQTQMIPYGPKKLFKSNIAARQASKHVAHARARVTIAPHAETKCFYQQDLPRESPQDFPQDPTREYFSLYFDASVFVIVSNPIGEFIEAY